MSPMLVDFADGFTSSSEPVVEGAVQENYTLLDNQATLTNITGLVLDNAKSETYFADYELKRGAFKQDGRLMFRYAGGAWAISHGNYDGDTLIKDALVNPQDIVLAISGGQLQYQSGLVGSAGTLKILISRIAL